MPLWPGIVVRALVMLALLVRVLPAPAAGLLVALPSGIPICHGDGAAAPSAPDDRPDRTHDCVLCPVCLTAGALPLLLAPAAAVPPPSVTPSSARALPPATGPPHDAVAVVRSRGPPV